MSDIRTVSSTTFYAMTVVMAFVFSTLQANELDQRVAIGNPVILDGDTIRIDKLTIRLSGIDAPETGQLCIEKSGFEGRCGVKSTQQLARLIDGAVIRCVGSKQDAYGRLLANCFDEEARSLNDAMVSTGWAVAFLKYDQTYASQELFAKEQGLGIWETTFQRPKDFREQRWKAAGVDAPPEQPECVIKGNINAAGTKIYHMPWHRHYKITRINLSKGERYFCNEQEALSEGWRITRSG